MSTLPELIERYQSYTDDELMVVYQQMDAYSPEAKDALLQVIEQKGGIAALKERLAAEEALAQQRLALQAEVVTLLKKGSRHEAISLQVDPQLLASPEADELISQTVDSYLSEKADRKIKPKTLIGGLFGGFIGGTLGGIIWGIQMIQSGRMLLILVFGLAVISYGFIRLFTRQSKKNIVVLVMTIISVVYALVLGQIIFEVFTMPG
jgi:hypothetical protein